jgi:hypothetical protein
MKLQVLKMRPVGSTTVLKKYCNSFYGTFEGILSFMNKPPEE